MNVDGEDVREWPLVEWRRRLRRLIPSVSTRLMYVDHVQARGRDFFEVACAHDLRGHRGQARERAAIMRTAPAPTGSRSRIPRTRR
jgi:hypothetical protein